jgi:hypothetical protein
LYLWREMRQNTLLLKSENYKRYLVRVSPVTARAAVWSPLLHSVE